MAQVIGFNCGGFVVHKALGQRLSAWYDADCNLLDSVLTDSLGRQRRPSKKRFRDSQTAWEGLSKHHHVINLDTPSDSISG